MTMARDVHPRAPTRPRTDGFTRVEGVIPDEPIDRLLAALPCISRVDLDDPSTGYHDEGVIPLHHHPGQWDIRHPALHRVFAEPGDPAPLMALGRRLVGVDAWV